MRIANDLLRFTLELAALAAVCYWGFETGSGAGAWLLGLAAPLAIAVLWGRWIAPKAPQPARDPLRLALELIVFGSATAALIATGEGALAAILAFAAAFHLALTFPLGQRDPAAIHRTAT